jgi:hypothetical protein
MPDLFIDPKIELSVNSEASDLEIIEIVSNCHIILLKTFAFPTYASRPRYELTSPQALQKPHQNPSPSRFTPPHFT